MSRKDLADLSFFNEEAANVSREKISFGFGANWKKFVTDLSDEKIKRAQDSFARFARVSDLENVTFLDIGCGSGLSSLVAHRLGAKRIVSVDVDPNSLDCVSILRRRFASNAKEWKIVAGSVLDRNFMKSIGRFSYVYSWGVLHHTGSMWHALENVIPCVEPGGKLHIALYNENRNSARWLAIKRICNRWPRIALPFFKASYGLYGSAKSVARFQSPVSDVRQYEQDRGMNFWRDVEDWLGGLPYEYSKTDHVVDFLSDRRFVLLRLKSTTTKGCNEFLFKSEIS